MSTKQGGLFVVFEGTDGAGKTTQVQLLYERLTTMGQPVVCMAFPTSTFISCMKLIDDVVKTRKGATASTLAEPEVRFLAMASDRYSMQSEIRAHLSAGKIVLCDRYDASGAVYASALHGVSLDWAIEVESREIKPNAYVFLDVDVREALDRNEKCTYKRRGDYDTLQAQSMVYSEYLRYFARAEMEGKKVVRARTEVSEGPRVVEQKIWDMLRPTLSL